MLKSHMRHYSGTFYDVHSFFLVSYSAEAQVSQMGVQQIIQFMNYYLKWGFGVCPQ